jgi:hypothetical protein
MAIAGPKYLVMEAAMVGEGRWTTDLAPKPNCYLSGELAAARARELDERALRLGEVRTFRVHRADEGAPAPDVVAERSPA